MSKHMKFLTTEEINIILNLYEQSCLYIFKRINSKIARRHFVKTQKTIYNIFKSKLNEGEFLFSFYTTKTALIKAKDETFRSYHFDSLIETFFLDKEKYDKIIFNIALDILYKTKVRFFDGYVEQH